MGSPSSTSAIWGGGVAGVDNQAIWKNSITMPILKAEKPGEQGRSYRPISLIALQRKSWNGFSSRPSWRRWALVPSSTALNQVTPPPRPCSQFLLGWFVVLTNEISLAEPLPLRWTSPRLFHSVSPFLLMEMIHHPQLWHNLVRWLVTYLRGRKASCSAFSCSSTARLPAWCGQGATGICHLPSPLQPLCVGLPHYWLGHNVLRRQLHAAVLCSQHYGGWGEANYIIMHVRKNYWHRYEQSIHKNLNFTLIIP